MTVNTSFPVLFTTSLDGILTQNESDFNNSLCIFNDSCLCNETLFNITCDNNSTTEVALGPPYSLWLSILLGLMAAIVIVMTICGNILVLLAFAVERNIRQPTNYFIASLAVSDLLIGTFSMPCFTLYLLLGKWPLGEIICDLWLSLDWTVCLASQYTVFFITVDRFFSVKIPAKYRNWRSERKVVIMVVFTWIIPAAVFFTSIIGWQYFVGERTVDPHQCEVQFMSDPLFTFLLTIGYYWITLIVMIGLYAGIYHVALTLQRKSNSKQRKMKSAMELSAEKNKQKVKNKSAPAAPATKKAENNNARQLKGAVNTTSFTKNAEEDRSSSPAFASDDENSSSGGAAGNSKTPLTDKNLVDDEDDEQTCFVNSAVQTDTTYRPSLKGMLGASFNQMSRLALSITATNTSQEENQDEKKKEETPPPAYDNIIRVNFDEKSEKPTDSLIENDILQGCKYIDEESLKSLTSAENIKLLSDPGTNYDSSADEASSPIWKRRNDRSYHITIPEESTMMTSSTDIIEVNVDDQNLNNDQMQSKVLNRDQLPANGKNHVGQRNHKDLAEMNSTESHESHLDKMRKIGSPFHALVKSMREKQKMSQRREKKVKSKSENRARKALRTITFILGAYVLCWTPYHIMVFIIGICGGYDCINTTLYQFTYWLCYLNSPINPFCYALANQQFKKTFLRILRCDCHRT